MDSNSDSSANGNSIDESNSGTAEENNINDNKNTDNAGNWAGKNMVTDNDSENLLSSKVTAKMMFGGSFVLSGIFAVIAIIMSLKMFVCNTRRGEEDE